MNKSLIRAAWCRETSADPEGWTPENPAWGQCAVTALLVQELFGGDLIRVEVASGSHYYNKLDDGTVLDLTGEQFGDNWSMLDRDDYPLDEYRDRAYVLSYPDTLRRYQRLRSLVFGAHRLVDALIEDSAHD